MGIPELVLGASQQIITLLEKIRIRDDSRLLAKEQANFMGNQAELTAPTVAGFIPSPGVAFTANTVNSVVVVQTRAEKPFNPGMVTITLNNPLLAGSPLAAGENPATIGVLEIKARIEWGSGGFTNTADVDYAAGTQVTVLGSFIRVTALYAVNAIGIIAAPIINVGASLAEGTRPGGRFPTWSRNTGIHTNPGVTFNQFIPDYARDVTVWCAEGAAAPINPLPYRLSITDSSSTEVATWIQASGEPPPSIPIFGQTPGFLLVTNPAGNPNPVTITTTFGIAL